MFLAPNYRIDQGSLWDELVDRLRDGGHELGPANRLGSLVTAPSKDGQGRLMLTSWQLLLDTIAQRTKKDGDAQACFEIAELQGLAASAIAGDNPRFDENLRRLIRDAVERVEQSDWANTDRLTAGVGHDYYARYLRLAGASAGLLIHYKAVKQIPDKPAVAVVLPRPHRQSECGGGAQQIGQVGRIGTGMASRRGLCTNRLASGR